MIDSILLLGYDPKCTIYKRKQGKTPMWYINYKLPNGFRVRRPVHRDYQKARKLMRLKELQLLAGEFDEKDRIKLGDMVEQPEEVVRLTIEKGLELYHKVADARKSPETRYKDFHSIKQHFGYFQNTGKNYFDEIETIDVLLFISMLDKEGKSESTIKNAVAAVRKVFNCLIEDAKALDYQNPVPEKRRINLPKKGGLVRKRLLTDVEVKALLGAKMPFQKSATFAPIKEIVRFMVHTGCRVSEVLHAEWPDFDMNQGIWRIRIKPECPTRHGLGWAPKWHKERDVILTFGAIEVLKEMPIVRSIGIVQIRNEKGKVVGHEEYPADFVFPKKKKVGRVAHGQTFIYTRVDSLKTAWKTLRDQADVHNAQLKDLRTYFNHKLRSKYGFSAKEAGEYIGNSKEINDQHYTPVSMAVIRSKLTGSDDNSEFLN